MLQIVKKVEIIESTQEGNGCGGISIPVHESMRKRQAGSPDEITT
jgi:hypothetical protein